MWHNRFETRLCWLCFGCSTALSCLWAPIEHLNEIKCNKTMFQIYCSPCKFIHTVIYLFNCTCSGTKLPKFPDLISNDPENYLECGFRADPLKVKLGPCGVLDAHPLPVWHPAVQAAADLTSLWRQNRSPKNHRFQQDHHKIDLDHNLDLCKLPLWSSWSRSWYFILMLDMNDHDLCPSLIRIRQHKSVLWFQ